jgi:hypothetical protein
MSRLSKCELEFRTTTVPRITATTETLLATANRKKEEEEEEDIKDTRVLILNI